MPPTAIAAAGLQQASNLVGEIMGIGLQPLKNKQQVKQQARLNQVNEASMKEMGKFNYEQQMKMWEATNYSAQKEQMKKAGLNPGLMYGMGGGGGATTAAQPGQSAGGGAGIAQASRGNEGMGMMMGQMALLEAERKKIEAETRKLNVDANKTEGVDTELGQTQIENLKQGIKNQKTLNRIAEFEEDMKKIDAAIAEQTKSWKMEQITDLAEITNVTLEALRRDNDINESTREQKIMQIKAEAIGAVLRNGLTEAQTEGAKAGTAKTKAEIGKIANDMMLGWNNWSLEERKTKLAEALGGITVGNAVFDRVMRVIEAINPGKK